MQRRSEEKKFLQSELHCRADKLCTCLKGTVEATLCGSIVSPGRIPISLQLGC